MMLPNVSLPPPTLIAPPALIKIAPPSSLPSATTAAAAPKEADAELDPIEAQINALRQQIVESEQNLTAHFDSMQEMKKV